MNIKDARFTSIEQVTGHYLNPNTSQTPVKESSFSFENILKQKVDAESDAGSRTGEIKFSKHAMQRLTDRNIDLSSEQLDRLKKGAQLSNEKGIKESLVLMDEYAFIVNTQKNTVITAMEQGRNGENIYTNIDGAVLV